MKKSERLKSRIKIKFKYFILAHILTLFFVLAPVSPAGGPIASAAGNIFNYSLENTYDKPFSKLIDFLNEKKNELEKHDDDFPGAKVFLSPADLSAEEEEEEGGNNNSILSADEINPDVSSFASAVFESVKIFVVDNPKQYFGTVFESVKNFVFPGPNQNNFEYNSPSSESAAREMENLKQQYAETIEEAKSASQKFNTLQAELNKIKNSGVVVREPVIEQRVVERTIEKIISGLSQTDLDSGLSNLRTELQNLNTNLLNQINTLSASSNRQTSAVYQAVSLTNKIDSLSGTRLSNITVSGVSGLADSDIPDTITASNYLPLTGGTITGSTTISGQTNLSNATTSLLTVSGGAWFTSGNVGIGTTSPYAKLSVVGPVAAEYFHATSTTSTSTFSGQTVAGFAPTLAHNFGSWSVGASGANPLGASFIINPSSAASDSNLLSLSVNGSAKFLVDAEGDIFANAVTVVGGTTLSTTTASTFTVEGNTYLGDATTTDITYFNSRIADSLIPTADNLLDLGDSANWLRWRTGYFGTSVGIGGTATSTGTQITTSGAYLIDSNNTLSINTTNNKAVSFGTGNVSLPYASTTALTISGSAYIGSLNGPLQANNGLVSATTSVGSIYGGTGIDSSALTGIAQIVSGTWSASSTLSTAYGGTGWNNIQSNSILLGNGAGRLATTSAGTDGYVLALSAGVPTWLATSTLSTITGTLTVAKGGTGQTSFGQGWLHSDGTTFTSSTSPTVNYITATSTTATSTFPYLSVTTNSNLGTVIGGTWNGTAVGDAYLTKSGDWTGTLDTYNGSDLLARANHTGTQGVSTLSNYDWTFSNNYGAINLTGSSTKPIWAQGGINASSTSNFVYASTTALTISGNSYLGTVSSGAWNGTAIGNAYVDDDITLTNITQITNRAITDTTGTLTVARGGTGQTSFGQGWLNSNGTTLSASTSPTVNYIVATSTTATSTFSTGGLTVGTSQFVVQQTSGNVGIGTTEPKQPLQIGSSWLNTFDGTTVTASYDGTVYRATPQINISSLTSNNTSALVKASGLNIHNYQTAATGLRVPALTFSEFANAGADPAIAAIDAVDMGQGIDANWRGGALTFHTAQTSGSYGLIERMRIDNTGNVGIGTTTPGGKLYVVTSDVAVVPDTRVDDFTIENNSDAGISILSANNLTGGLFFGDIDNSARGRLVYNHATDALSLWSAGLERLTVDTNGNVGIGTTSPTSLLYIAGANVATEYGIFGNLAVMSNTSQAADIGGSITLGGTTNGTGAFGTFAAISGRKLNSTVDNNSGYLAFETELSGTGLVERMRIDNTGNVGIGTSTPARRLDVADSGNNNPQMRLSRETNVYTDFSVAQTTGDLSLALYGANADDISLFMPDGSTGANLWVCEGAACPNGISFTGGGNLFVEGVIKYATSTTPKTRRSIILTAAGAIVPATSGAAKTQVDGTNHSYYVLDYDASSDEAAYWQWTMPDSYDNGSIDVTYYWEAGATSGNATFCSQAKGLSANGSEDIDSALSSAVCETDGAQANANDLASITETNATSNFTAGEYVTFKVFRDVDNGDTMTGDARLVKVKIEYGVATESD